MKIRNIDLYVAGLPAWWCSSIRRAAEYDSGRRVVVVVVAVDCCVSRHVAVVVVAVDRSRASADDKGRNLLVHPRIAREAPQQVGVRRDVHVTYRRKSWWWWSSGSRHCFVPESIVHRACVGSWTNI